MGLNTLKKITLTCFRNYSFKSFAFEAPVICITGPNGSGKTNLLDAIYYLCYTKSYFSAYQQHSVQNGMDGFRLDGDFEQVNDSENIVCKWKQGKKEIFADEVVYEKITDHIGKYAAVMIAPDDLQLINGGSEQRRKWMDSILFQTDKEYMHCLLQYQHVLQQRNAWLKMQAVKPSKDWTQLDYYNEKLSLNGNYLYKMRTQFVSEILPVLGEYYKELSGDKEDIRVLYNSDLSRFGMGDLLKKSLEHDLKLQRTTKGIHKDDFDFFINELSLKQFASQGQKKSFLFALKLTQFSYLSKYLQKVPILLLDDIFEKLDQQRIEALLQIIQRDNFGQVFITDTDKERVKAAFAQKKEVEFIQL